MYQKKDISSIREAKSIIGDDIKKEKVAPPKGSPADINPMNIGMLEQEQKGVTVPNRAPNIFPFNPLNLPMIFFGFLWRKITLYEGYNKYNKG